MYSKDRAHITGVLYFENAISTEEITQYTLNHHVLNKLFLIPATELLKMNSAKLSRVKV